MICGRFIRRPPRPRETALDRMIEPVLDGVAAFYARSLDTAFRHRALMLLVTFAAMGLTVYLYIIVPKALLPRGDTGLIMGFARASPDTSFLAMTRVNDRVLDVLMSDPAVSGVSSSVGGSGFGSGNQVRYFLNLKPLAERQAAEEIITRLRPRLAGILEAQVSLFTPQEITIGARGGRSQYQVTLWSTELTELARWVPQAVQRIRGVPGILDVNTDREQGGPEAFVRIDRLRASKLGVSVRDITAALNDAFSQRQVATLYRSRNQYRIILEVDPSLQRDAGSLHRLFVSAADGTQVPLSSVATIESSSAPLVVNHQRQFPSATISFNVAEDAELSVVTPAIEQALAELHMPDEVHIEMAGEAGEVAQTQSSQTMLILAALITVYLVLGILYENLIHPPDDPLDASVSGPGGSPDPVRHRDEPVPHRPHRHHAADRDRQEERDHAGRLRDRGPEDARVHAGGGHPGSLHRTVPADHHDDPRVAPRRPAPGSRHGIRGGTALAAGSHDHRRADPVSTAHDLYDTRHLPHARSPESPSGPAEREARGQAVVIRGRRTVHVREPGHPNKGPGLQAGPRVQKSWSTR